VSGESVSMSVSWNVVFNDGRLADSVYITMGEWVNRRRARLDEIKGHEGQW